MDIMSSAGSKRKAVSGSTVLLIALGWICAIASLFFYPFIFGVAGVVMGILATKNGGKAGIAVIIANIVLMGIGLIYSGVIINYTKHFLGMI